MLRPHLPAGSRQAIARVPLYVLPFKHPRPEACIAGRQVKNSLRAVNDRYEDAEEEPPPVRVVVAEGAEDVCIKARVLMHLGFFGIKV